MDVENRHPTGTVEDGRRAAGLYAAAITGFAVSSLVSAVVVAAFGAVAASPPYCATDQCAIAAGEAQTLAWTVAGAGAVTVAAVALSWRTGAAQRAVQILAALCAAALIAAYVAVGLAAGGFPASGQKIWLVRLAVWLAVAGCAAVVISVRPKRLNRVAMAAAAAFAVLGWQDARNALDARTAGEVDIPPVPKRLGTQRFKLSVPYFKPSVESAGAGFVVWTRYWAGDPAAPDVVAFDSSGTERWHYRHDRWNVAQLRVFDAGRTLVLALADDQDGEDQTVIALDAVTGTELWRSTDETIRAAVGGIEDGRSNFLMLRGPEQWTAFDPRTGQQIWRIPSPATCPQGALEPLLDSDDGPITTHRADNDAELVTVIDCSTPEQIRLRVLVTDPQTGRPLIDRPVTPLDGQQRAVVDSFIVDGPAADSSISLRVSTENPGVTTQWFNYQTGQTVDFGDEWLYQSYQPRGDFLSVGATGKRTVAIGPDDPDHTVRVYNADKSLRCQFARRSRGYWPPIWLTDQLVTLEYSKAAEIRIINRDDCRTETTLPLPFPPAK